MSILIQTWSQLSLENAFIWTCIKLYLGCSQYQFGVEYLTASKSCVTQLGWMSWCLLSWTLKDECIFFVIVVFQHYCHFILFDVHPPADIHSDPKTQHECCIMSPTLVSLFSSLLWSFSSLSSVGLASQLYPSYNAISPAVMGNIALHNSLITHLQN